MQTLNVNNALTPEQRKLKIINVTSQYMRELVENSERPLPIGSGEMVTGYDVKAMFLLCHHSTLNIMRVLNPDFMHIYYENIFAKSFVTIFAAKNFHRADRARIKARRESLMGHFKTIGAFEEHQNTMKLFTAASSNTPIKTADIRTVAPVLFSFFDFVYHAEDEGAASQFYADFAGAVLSQQRRNHRAIVQNAQLIDADSENVFIGEDGDPGTLYASDITDNFRELVYLMVELNTFLQGLCSFDVPLEYIHLINGSSIMKASDIALLVSIQLFSEQDDTTKFVDELFRLPCHYILHMIDRWEDVGNYGNISCWCTERGCNTVRNLQHPAGNVYRNMHKRLVHKFIRDNYNRYFFEEERLSRFECAKAAEIKHSFYQREIDAANEKSGKYNPKVRVLRTSIAIGTFKLLNKFRCYGKFKKDGEWIFFKAEQAIQFEYFNHEEILPKFKRIRIQRKWKRSSGGLVDFCYTALIHEIDSSH